MNPSNGIYAVQFLCALGRPHSRFVCLELLPEASAIFTLCAAAGCFSLQFLWFVESLAR